MRRFSSPGGASRSHSITPLAARRLTPTKVPCPRPPSRSSPGAAAQHDHYESASTSTASSPCDSKKPHQHARKSSHEVISATNKTAADPAAATMPRNLKCATNSALDSGCSTSSFVRSPVSEQSFTLAASSGSESPVVVQAMPSSSLSPSPQAAQVDQEGADDPLQEFSGSSGYNSSSPDQEITRDPRTVALWSEKATEEGDGPSRREPRQGEH